MKYEPKKGEPFKLATFLDETVRMSDHATRDVHTMAMNRIGKPTALREIAERYRHIASRLDYAADDLNERAKLKAEAANG